MKENEIQKILDQLGNKVSLLSEENRVCKIRDDASKKLICLLAEYISKENWVDLYNSTNDQFIKDLMDKWGKDLF